MSWKAINFAFHRKEKQTKKQTKEQKRETKIKNKMEKIANRT